MEVYPNPVSKEFKVLLNGSQKSLRLELFSLTGVLLLSRNITNGEATDISEYPEGLYFLRVFDADSFKVYNTSLLVSH